MFTMAIRKAQIKRISCFAAAVFFLIAALPISSLAVDPISGSIIANAFAQAITGYGAAQGVSILFDISHTSQIGEGIHELWKQFRADNNELDDYLDIAAAIYPSVFHKIVKAGKAYLGLKLAAEYVADLDGFWNWVMSGPAEIEKVDNQYYQFSNNEPILVSILNPFANVPVIDTSLTVSQRYQTALYIGKDQINGSLSDFKIGSNNYPVSAFLYKSGNTQPLAFVSTNSNFIGYYYFLNNNNEPVQGNTASNLHIGNVYYNIATYSPTSDIQLEIYDSLEAGLAAYESYVTDGNTGDSLYVAPYIGESTPQDVYIPDNEDVNYVPLPADIPLDIPWDDSLFGDGTGTLSDDQVINAVNSLDSTIEQLKSLLLAGDNAITVNPTDTFNSILPFGQLPSFNFNLAGIWYYVRNWVASLGSFITTMFNAWSALPGIITLPVYATAVIVIVLGVYKRFFM